MVDDSHAPWAEQRPTAGRLAGRLLLASFLVVFAVLEARIASVRLYWGDELVTLVLTEAESVPELYRWLSTGMDLNPPPYYLLTMGSRSLLGPTPLASRLPSLLGFLLSIACIYRFVERRSGPVAAWIAMFLGASGPVYYATEARPHALVLGGFTLALLSWQSATSARRGRIVPTLGIAAGLTLALCSHFYAVLLFPPLAVGELVRTRGLRRADVPILAAIAAPALVLLACLPLLLEIRAEVGSFREHFWATIARDPYAFLGSYQRLFSMIGQEAVAVALGLALLAIVPGRRGAPDRGEEPGGGFPPHEAAALVWLVALPVIATVLGHLVTGIYVDRYVLATIIGVACLIGDSLGRRAATGTAGLVVLAVLTTGLFALKAIDTRRQEEPSIPRFIDVVGCLHREQSGLGLPTVVDNAELYLRLHTFDPKLPGLGLRCVVSAELAAKYRGTNTDQLTLTKLGEAGIADDIVPFETLLEEFPRFLFVGGGGGGWLEQALRDRHATFRPVSRCGPWQLSVVTLPPATGEGPGAVERDADAPGRPEGAGP